MISTKKTIKTKNLFPLKHLQLLPLPERLLMILMNSPKLSQVSRKKTKDKPKKVQDEAEAFRCSHCYYASRNWEQFKQHMNVGHKLAPLFPCMIPFCWTYYQSKNGLKGHCRCLHSELLSCSLYYYALYPGTWSKR